MTMLDVAQSLRGKLRDGASAVQSGGAPESKAVRFGVAQSDSSGGFVDILLDNAPTTEPGYSAADYTFSVACDSPIKANDRVSYVVIDGVGKAISLGGLTDMAGSAISIANAVNQHFWNDTSGVHVSDAKPIVAGTRNILLNAYGMALYKGDPAQSTGVNKGLLLASFAEDEVNLGYMPNPSEGDSATVNFFSADTYLQVLATAGGYKRMILQADDYYIGNLIITSSYMKFGGKMVLTEDDLPYYNERGASAYLTNTAAASTTTTLAKVTLGASIKQSSLASSLFAKSSNGIQCNKAGTVLVSGQVYCQSMGSSNNLAVDIYQNSSSICEAVSSCGSGGLCTVSIPPRAITVAANDVIYLYVKSTNAVTNGIPVGGAALTVQYI